MNADLERLWKQAEANPGQSVDIGRNVVCDFCDADHTDSTVTGGVIFGSKAVCPTCVPRVQGEPEHIKARCPEGVTFGDFVRTYRGANNTITIRPISTPSCGKCGQPFTSANVHTAAGWAETELSGPCEDCFDALFADTEDEE